MRSPDPGTLGADLLCRLAVQCDLPGAFRLMKSSSFSAEWLTRSGSSGETPLKAALRSGCSQLVALMMLQPGFDFSTVRKFRQRRELAQYAQRCAPPGKNVRWALEVLDAIRLGRDTEVDPTVTNKKELDWYLPSPGEWASPTTLEDVGITLPVRPMIPEHILVKGSTKGFVETSGGIKGRADIVVHLWCLMVTYLQSAEGSERRAELARHIRSMGWTFFFGSRSTLARHTHILDMLARGHFGSSNPEVEDKAEDLELRKDYRFMGAMLAQLWNRTGDFVLA